MDAKALLTAMADLFTNQPERWTHGDFARNAKNEVVGHLGPDAFSFSAGGFLERSAAEGLLDQVELARAYDLLIGAGKAAYSGYTLVQLNDIAGREAVIAAARRAAQ